MAAALGEYPPSVAQRYADAGKRIAPAAGCALADSDFYGAADVGGRAGVADRLRQHSQFAALSRDCAAQRDSHTARPGRGTMAVDPAIADRKRLAGNDRGRSRVAP